MTTSNITRRILNLFVALHRKSIVRDLNAVRASTLKAAEACDDQYRVIKHEEKRFADLCAASRESAKTLNIAECSAERELSALPRQYN